MRPILPPGYSLPQRRKRLETELRRARAAELAKPNEQLEKHRTLKNLKILIAPRAVFL
jgi:hypothetical protein